MVFTGSFGVISEEPRSKINRCDNQITEEEKPQNRNSDDFITHWSSSFASSGYVSLSSSMAGFLRNILRNMTTHNVPSVAYSKKKKMNISPTCDDVVAASSTFMNPRKIHGCLPSSAKIQPNSIAATASGPINTRSLSIHLFCAFHFFTLLMMK